MLRVHVLANRRRSFHRHLHPLYKYKELLRDFGFDVQFFFRADDSHINECDVLIVFDASYREILPIQSRDREHAIGFLEGFLKSFPRVVWFDDGDSSGRLRTYVLPLVDVYAKSQLVNDFDFYTSNDAGGGAKHTDFACLNHQLVDEFSAKGPISESDAGKLRVGWNLALINWDAFNASRLGWYLSDLFPLRRDRVKTCGRDLASRDIDVNCRVGTWEGIKAVNWWRNKTLSETRKMTSRVIRIDGTISKKRYRNELKQTKVCVSPFGIGEICYRDFEAFAAGAVLVKPDISYLRTFPDLYAKEVTYLAHDWFFDDYRQVLESVLSDSKRFDHLASTAQKLYLDAISDGEGFVRHFSAMIS